MSDFKRERRYEVIKLKTGSPVECLVIESDWPEYDIGWQMIQDRVECKPNELDRLRAEVASLKEDLGLARIAVEQKQERLEAADANIADITQKLAAVNGRGEMMREALEIAYDHLLAHWTEEQLKTVAPLHKIPAAIADLPEADKEK